MKRLGIGIAAAALLAVPASANADTVTLSNSDGIDFAFDDPSVHPGDPYPSTVTGPAGTVNDVNVTIQQTHANPDDLDIALVSPNGTAVTLQSDACLLDSNVLRPLTFDDASGIFLPDNGNCPSASNPYKPSNYEGPDIYAAPGPASTVNTLAAFNGGPSGGAWNLFTMDDTTGSGGSILGWSIALDFTPTPPVTTPPGINPPGQTTGVPGVKKGCKKKKGKGKAKKKGCKKKKKKKK